MDKKYGVEQIIKVLDVVVEVGNVSEKVASATTVMGKVMAIIPLSDELLCLMSLSPLTLKAEFSELDADEKKLLQDHVKEKFDIADDQIESKVELGLTLVSEAVEFIGKAVDYAKSFRKEA